MLSLLRRRKRKSKHDGVTPNRYSAYWWEPGCTCHWSAGIDADYCDFCKSKSHVSPHTQTI